MEFESTFEQLTPELSICVTPDHKFGTDAFLLAHFAGHRRKDLACDLGSGCGIIPLLWFRKDPPRQVYAVEIQPKAIEQLKLTVERNGLHGRLLPVLADLKALDGLLPAGQFDLVTCNPPYKVAKTGILSELDSERIARHEVLCTIRDVCASAARLLKFGGRLCVCQRPERLPDVLEAMRQAGVEPKRLRFVQQREGCAPWLFLVQGKRGAKPSLQVEKPLIIEGGGRDGFSEELLEIYGGGKV
ncbi:methyltransferase [Clostridiaceae bacterium NSJ-31]|uniref:Methyltransferase n=1 Tax=Ligaoa zhengdingensis TaxID=2763658 RepID=A0A926DUQ6_9FIRM|nr:methyltransferase [Ligaoa zhengdingensis]MBC8545635.1 methyltransferase [Ligaoa zhengdingensis]